MINIFSVTGSGPGALRVGTATLEAEKFTALFQEGEKFDGVVIPDESNIRAPADSDNAGWFYVSTIIYFEAR